MIIRSFNPWKECARDDCAADEWNGGRCGKPNGRPGPQKGGQTVLRSLP
jgi:hypothetical protein